ncbi:FAD-dependent oxidoreductase [Patescibacteria group bacterium]|nr:FAD-dependent oxidoreductase [Patescibacteria group bacterium]
MSITIPLDVLVIGGGSAGLWLLDELRRKGHSAVLVESDSLGKGQTIASQGILHGGMKHALVARPGTFVKALGSMTRVWRECLSGDREPDLSSVSRRSDSCYFWRTSSFASFVGSFGARFGIRSEIKKVAYTSLPDVLRGASGDVYQIDEQVIDPSSLVSALFERNRPFVIRADVARVELSSRNTVIAVHLSGSNGYIKTLKSEFVVLTAGEGNAALRKICGLPEKAMLLLPLQILVLRGDLPDLNGVCLEGTQAKAVITTHRLSNNDAVWQFASERIDPEASERFAQLALGEIAAALPGFNFPKFSVSVYTAKRAECATESGGRCADVAVFKEGNVVTAWPTKLVLVPRMVERVMGYLPFLSSHTGIEREIAEFPRPEIAPFPWVPN